MSDFVRVCEQAARAGGAVLRHWEGQLDVREKGPYDLVSLADVASQDAIRQLVLEAFPDHGFVGEEDSQGVPSRSGHRWIVDPLDGTTNYVRGIPHYSVSVALEHEGQILAGAVFDPVIDECFTAEAGQGAWLNGKPLQTGPAEHLNQAMVAASFPAKVDAMLPVIAEMVAVLPVCMALRRGGSAALNLAYIAAARYDAYWAADLKPWDAAAGALLITEAGGTLTNLEGGDFDVWNPRLLAAANQSLHSEFFQLLSSLPRGK